MIDLNKIEQNQKFIFDKQNIPAAQEYFNKHSYNTLYLLFVSIILSTPSGREDKKIRVN